ncbi:MAG: ATP-dependent endonuclease [Candidatus Bipolaricaulia bacterium]
MIRKLTLTGFKGFRKYAVSFRDSAVMVGPNNAGKSTLIGALQTTGLMLEHALRHRPQGKRDHAGERISAHYFSPEQFGFEDENVRFDFLGAEATFSVTLERQMQLKAVWPADPDEDPFFFLKSSGGVVHEAPASVKSDFPTIGVVPAVVPLEQRERILTDDYIRKNLGRRLSSRHFRNQLLLASRTDSDTLDGYYATVAEWLPEIELEPPQMQRSLDESSVDLYYKEGRRPREVAWAGDGLQVFLQLLWHVHRLRNASTIILDEPEVYLHPDLQRRLMQVLVASGQQFVLATHSPEIVSEAPQAALVWVDRSRRSARRVEDDSTLSDLSTSIGSPFNLGLARVLRTKAAVFVEGSDTAILRRVANVCGFRALSREQEVAFVPLGGIARHSALEGFSWLAHDFLGDAVQGFVILDRDYRTDDECRALRDQIWKWGLGCHIWKRHELESYLLVPSVISRVAGISLEQAARLLAEGLEAVKEEAFAGLFGTRCPPLRKEGLSDKTIAQRCQVELEERWRDLGTRLALCPGKEVLAEVNRLLQESGNKAVSPQRLSTSLEAYEVPAEMRSVLETIQMLGVDSA